MKRILLISYYFFPSSAVGAKRVSYLAGYLVKCGYDVSVITVNENLYATKDPQLRIEGINLIRTYADLMISRQRTSSETFFQGLKRRITYAVKAAKRHVQFPDEYSGWIKFAMIEGSKLLSEKKYDFIIASGTPWSSFIIAEQLAVKFSIPFIVDYRDPWTLYPLQVPNPWIMWRSQKYEKQLLKTSKHVLVNTETAKILFLKAYGDILGNKISVVRNGYDDLFLERFKKEAAGLKLVDSEPNKFVLVHTGLFYQTRRAENLLHALSELMSEQNDFSKKFQLISYGPLVQSDRQLVKKLGLNDIVIESDFVSYGQCLLKIKNAAMALLVVGHEHGPMIPAKLFDYFMVGKPIFCIGPQDSEASRLIKQYHYGVACQPLIGEIKKYLNISIDNYFLGKLQDLDPPKDLVASNQYAKIRSLIEQ